ncbi:hypothetical protein RND71_006275 [Anisodus tanguticus]|uniref:BSD domain-containing protein n=1 Tax=Anisodus tanguticus TaxID=243964 RepID=A0AAE1SQJ5_9SOLA|nr:hypothetical protein RND71_006275 [Anisodus tanguticus]
MSSWFSLPLPNPFKFDDDVVTGGEEKPSSPPSRVSDPNSSGVKDDFSAISQTFSHHLRGVAAFLAPTSPTLSSEKQSDQEERFSGIKSDLVEIGDSFKSSLSMFSSKLTTISQRPQLWTDFPISLPSDFSMSDSQKEHVASIVQFVPRLESLRHKVCHELSDGQFWLIYFVLLLPRLNGNDLELLSTPEAMYLSTFLSQQIVEVRETLLQQLQSKNDPQPEASKDSETVDASEKDVKVLEQQASESKLEEKNISAETANASQDKDRLHGEKPQQQLEDEKTKTTTSYADKNEDDVSFSDLEDDDTDLSDRLQGSKPTHRKKVSSSSESHEWIQLNDNSRAQGSQQKAGQSIHRDKDSEGEESNDWLTVDDIDSDSLVTN